MTKKKILFLITKSNWGGAQRYVFDLATNLDKSIYDVVVVLGGNGQLRDELEREKIRTITLTNLERDISLLKELKSTFELFTVLKAEKPDVLHINSSKAGGLGAFLGRILNVRRIIFTAHGWAFNEDRPRWQKCAITFLHWCTVLLAHTTITVSETLKKQLSLSFIQKKMVAIHNGRTTPNLYSRDFARSFFIKYIPELKEHVDDFWSVTIGELHPIKQHDVTIHALAPLITIHPHIRHIIISDGEERTRLEQLVRNLGLTNHVFFAGHILEASHYLKAFDLFVLASRSEALGYVIIEACIAGLPIIASNVGGIPEIITHEKEGLLFPQGDTTLLTKYYQSAYENKELRNTLGQNALLRASDFSFEKMLRTTEKLYSS